MRLGQLLYNYRTKNKISMDAFAEKTGLSKAYVSLLEKGIRPVTNKPIIPSIETIKKVAVGMEMDFNELFNLIDDNVLLDSAADEDRGSEPELPDDIRAVARGMMELSETDRQTAIDMINYLAQKGRDAKNK